jgi:hypothetical protein
VKLLVRLSRPARVLVFVVPPDVDVDGVVVGGGVVVTGAVVVVMRASDPDVDAGAR